MSRFMFVVECCRRTLNPIFFFVDSILLLDLKYFARWFIIGFWRMEFFFLHFNSRQVLSFRVLFMYLSFIIPLVANSLRKSEIRKEREREMEERERRRSQWRITFLCVHFHNKIFNLLPIPSVHYFISTVTSIVHYTHLRP